MSTNKNIFIISLVIYLCIPIPLSYWAASDHSWYVFIVIIFYFGGFFGFPIWWIKIDKT